MPYLTVRLEELLLLLCRNNGASRPRGALALLVGSYAFAGDPPEAVGLPASDVRGRSGSEAEPLLRVPRPDPRLHCLY